jgi:hypothetical protein
VVANLASKRDPEIARNLGMSLGKWRFSLPNIQFSLLKIQFSSRAFQFPRNPRKSSSMAFQFLPRISNFRNGFLIFLNGFPISSTAFQFSSTAFHFPRNPGKSIYDGKYTKDCYPSFAFQPKL